MFGLGSTSQLGIGIAIELNDRFSGRAAKVNGQLLAMRKNANSAVTGAMRDYRNLSMGIAGGAAAASIGIINMSKQASEFEHAINQIYIVGGKELGRGRAQLSGFAQEMSKTFSREPLEVASAMFENVRQGVTAGLEDITKYQIAAATATDEALGGDTGVAARLLNIMNAMDLPKSKFKDIANSVTAVANATQASVYSIGEAMQYGAFTAHQFNLPLSTTVALFGKISQAGIPGSSMGTAVNNMLTQLSKSLGPFQTKRQLKAWQMLGLDPKQLAGMSNSGNITGVIKALSDATSKMTPVQKGSILPAVLNMRGTRGLEALFDSKNGNKSIGDIIKASEAAIKGDLVMHQSKAMMNDLFSDFKFMANAFDRFKISFMTAAAPTLRTMMHVGTKVLSFISSIMSNPLGKIFAGIATVVIPTIGIMFAFRAAVLTATLALGGMGSLGQVGGFKGLLGAGLNAVGLSAFGNKGAGYTKNAAGRYFHPAGSVNAMGQKIGGRLVGAVELEAMGLSGARGVGLLGSIGGILGKAIPILGGILLGVEVLKALGLNAEAKNRASVDPLISQYYQNLDQAYMGKSMNPEYYANGGINARGQLDKYKGQALTQQIQINVDGKNAMSTTLQQNLDEQLDKQLNFGLPSY